MTSEKIGPEWWPTGVQASGICTGRCPACTRLLSVLHYEYTLARLQNRSVAVDGEHVDLAAYTNGARE